MIANYAYTRYEQIAPVVQQRIQEIQDRLFKEVSQQDFDMATLSDEAAEEAATQFSYRTASDLHQEWLDYYGELFSTYVDGLQMLPDPKNEGCRCTKHSFQFDDEWKEEIVSQTGDKYLVPEDFQHSTPQSIDKRTLRSFSGLHGDCSEESRTSVV